LLVVERAIKTNQYDWVWWIDYDTIITNLSIKLEDIIADALRDEKDPNAIDMIVTSDWYVLYTRQLSSSKLTLTIVSH
jgi:mannan polymerase II complex MNN10 subunit